jgi:ATP-dependent protease HslVU (ClpYQ) ATPase subunit
MLDKSLEPSGIVKQLDQYVIGQEDAKKILAVAVYSHYRKTARAGKDMAGLIKSNVLLIGPTGTGKTLMCETLSRTLDVPFVTADVTSLAQTRYVNEEIKAILQRLIDRAAGGLARAESGILFIDEIDTLKTSAGTAERTFRRGLAACPAENDGGRKGQAVQWAVHRYHRFTVHWWRRVRRPGKDHVECPHLRLRLDVAKRQQNHT